MIHLNEINLGIVCPMANERNTCKQFVEEVIVECNKFGFKSIQFISIFDKASFDGSYNIMSDLAAVTPELVVIFASENTCVVDAYLRGYKEALNRDCDWILEMDAGYSHQPSEVGTFFESMKHGYDCVFGSRFLETSEYYNSPGSRYLLSRGGTILTNLILGTKLHDMTSGFELFTHDALRAILEKGITSRGPFFQTEIKAFAHRYKIKEVPIHYNATGQTPKARYILDAFIGLLRLFKNKYNNSY